MKLTRAIGLLGLAMVVIAALAAPSLASAANWKENGTEINYFGPQWLKNGGSVAKSESFTLEGNYRIYSEESGNIDCSATAEATVNPSNNASFTTLTLSKCATGGVLAGCVVTSATSSGKPAFNAALGGVAEIVEFSFTYKLTGFLCPKEINVSGGTITGTPDNSAKFSNLTLSGKSNWTSEGKPMKSLVNMGGTLAAKPAATYGVGAAPTVALSGNLEIKGEGINVGCGSVTGSLKLQSGGAGQLTALNWAKCFHSGYFEPACGELISVTSNSLPWAVKDEGTSIKISGVSYTMQFQKGCSWKVSGTLTGTPDNKGAISNVKLNGVLETGGINYNWEGNLGWTPAAWYGL